MGVDSSEPKVPPLVMENVAAGEFFQRDLAFARLDRVRADVLLDVGIALQVRVAQHRHHQALFGRDRDADVVVLVIDDVIAFHRGVDRREFLQRFDGGLHEEGHEAELHAVLLLEAVLVLGAQVHHGLEVDLVERGELRLGLLGFEQALGDARAQRVMGTRWSWRPAAPTAGPERRASRPGVRASAAAASGLSRYSTTSPLVMRPSLPEAGIFAGSSFCSSTMRRTRRRELVAFVLRGAPQRPSAAAGAGAAAAGGRGGDASSSTASTWPLVTEVPAVMLQFLEHATHRRRHFEHHLVGLEVGEVLVARDRLAHLLVPGDQRGIRDRLG